MLRPRIRTVLLGANIVLLLLPLTGVWILHLYESALIRQTESELMAQAALLAASYRSAWLAAGGIANSELPQAQPITTDPYFPGQRAFPPLIAVLDLSDDPVLPPPDEATPASVAVEPHAKAAGEQLQPVLREAQTLTLAAVRLVDRQGIVVATTAGELGLSLQQQYEVSAALSGAAVSTLRRRAWKDPRPALDSFSRTSDLRVFVALPALLEDGAGNERVLGAVILSRTPRSITQALYAKRVPIAIMVLVLLGGGACIAWLIARLIAQPIAIVTREARRVAAGENTQMPPLARPMTREVAELSSSLVTMAATLERRAEYIGGFATAVSHEFKTPLTAMNGTIELLADHLESCS
ncbi:MAG TPA: histidine kinase dimerization/phospho-acceptor domain-containing protein [Caldimonas sp.]|nr:histidine kinase dimerization/phospho-acceptor domain-containing protein [Caldimonas sp.]